MMDPSKIFACPQCGRDYQTENACSWCDEEQERECPGCGENYDKGDYGHEYDSIREFGKCGECLGECPYCDEECL